MALIEMKAPRLNDDGDAFERAGDELALVAGDAGRGEARDLRVRDSQRALELVGEEAEAGAEDDRDARLERSEPPGDGRGRLVDQTSIPAMDALMKAARLPAIIARRPSRAMSGRRSGASPPIPPIWIAMDERLAKPSRQ